MLKNSRKNQDFNLTISMKVYENWNNDGWEGEGAYENLSYFVKCKIKSFFFIRKKMIEIPKTYNGSISDDLLRTPEDFLKRFLLVIVKKLNKNIHKNRYIKFIGYDDKISEIILKPYQKICSKPKLSFDSLNLEF